MRLFDRNKKVKSFSVLSTSGSEIAGASLSLHADSLLELQKNKNNKRYISKRFRRDKEGIDIDFLAAREVYSSWIFRLHVLDGSRIPKYSYITKYGKRHSDVVVFSEKVDGIKDLFDLHQEIDEGGYEFESGFVDLLKNFDNRRAFAQILVCSIVFAEYDLKGEHLVFDQGGRFTRIDFDQCFWPGLDFSANDFENLPLVSTFKPYNLFFNYAADQVEARQRAIGEEIAKLLGLEFKADVYEAVLKVLLMPDFLLEEIKGVLRGREGEIRDQGIELAKEKKTKLSACMMESEDFREFLRLHGEEAKGRILREIESFREHNSYFRKKWSKQAFHARCVESVDDACLLLMPKVFTETCQVGNLTQCVESVDDARSLLMPKVFTKTCLVRNLIIGLGISLVLLAVATAVLFFPPAGLNLPFMMGVLPILAKGFMVAGAGALGVVSIILSLLLSSRAKLGAVKTPSHVHCSSEAPAPDAALPVAFVPHLVSSPAPTGVMAALLGKTQSVAVSHRESSSERSRLFYSAVVGGGGAMSVEGDEEEALSPVEAGPSLR